MHEQDVNTENSKKQTGVKKSLQLIRGKGRQDFGLTQEEMSLLTAFRTMGKDYRGMVLGCARRLSFNHVNEKPLFTVIAGGKEVA